MSALTIGIPSKGRLQENTALFFERAGLALTRDKGSRGYRGALKGIGAVDVHYLSASDIAGQLATGRLHLGVTGEDLVHETIPEYKQAVNLLMPLGFGHANVVIAVPAAWIDVDTVADLDDISIAMRADTGRVPRIATKYLNITRRFLARHGMADFRDYRLVESSGATEGTPASGAADLIVDITSTGSTLAANALKVLTDGVMLESQANLVASLRADWATGMRQTLFDILIRIEAEKRGRENRLVTALADAAKADAVAAAFAAPTNRSGAGPVSISAVLPAGAVFEASARLREAGALSVTVAQVDYVFGTTSAVYDRLAGRLGW